MTTKAVATESNPLHYDIGGAEQGNPSWSRWVAALTAVTLLCGCVNFRSPPADLKPIPAAARREP